MVCEKVVVIVFNCKRFVDSVERNFLIVKGLDDRVLTEWALVTGQNDYFEVLK
jgi:hypothetical protein